MFDFLKRAEAEALADSVENGRSVDENTDKLLALVRDEAPPETVDAGSYDRVMEKISTARTGAAERPAGRAFSLKQALVATGLAAGLAAALFFGFGRAPSDAFIIKQALAAVEQPGMITYYKVVGNTEGMGESDPPMSTTEYWIDLPHHLVRSESAVKIGGQTMKNLSISDDKRLLSFERGKNLHVTESSLANEAGRPTGADMNNIYEQAEAYRAMLKDGRAQIAGEESINGVGVYKVTSTSSPGDANDEAVIAFIRQDNYQPVRVVYNSRYREGFNDDWRPAKSTFDFEAAKSIDPASLPADFFTLDVPDEADYALYETYTPERLRLFKEFDVFWLGESFAGLKVSPIGDYVKDIRREHVPAIHRAKRHEVGFSYNNPDKNQYLSITIMPAGHPSATNPPIETAYTKTEVVFDGQPALLFKSKLDAGFKKAFGADYEYLLISTKGNAAVFVSAVSEDLVYQAARALVKLN